MSDLGYNIWGVVAGALALIPIFIAWLHTRLPSTKIPLLLQALQETEILFSTAVRDGLFTDADDFYQFNLNVWGVTAEAEDIRSRVYGARTWRADVGNWWRGLSGRISALCAELDSVNMKLAERNSKERKRLLSEALKASTPSALDYQAKPPTSSEAHKVASQFTMAAPIRQSRTLALQPNSPSPGLAGCGVMASEIEGDSDLAYDARRHKSTETPAHHLISDADLEGLLSFARSRHAPLATSGNGRSLTRVDALVRQGRRRSRRTAYKIPHGKRQTERTPLDAILHLLRRAYGVRSRYAGPDVSYDPESLTIPGVPTDGSDGDGWEDV